MTSTEDIFTVVDQLTRISSKDLNKRSYLEQTLSLLKKNLHFQACLSYVKNKDSFEVNYSSNLPVEPKVDKVEADKFNSLDGCELPVKFFEPQEKGLLHPSLQTVVEEFSGFIPIILNTCEITVGYIILLYSSKPDLDQTRKEVIKVLAKIIASKLHNRLLSTQYEDRIRQAMSLNKISRAFMSTLEYEELLQRIISIIADNFDIINCSILLKKQGEKKLVIKNTLHKQADKFFLKEISFGEGITGTCASSAEPVNVSDVSDQEDYIEGLPQTKSELAVPMKTVDGVIGVLDVESKNIDNFDQQDEWFLSSLAAIAAVAIQRARLHNQVKQQAITDRLTGLYNRGYFEDYVKNNKEDFIRKGRTVGLIFIDVRHFKMINDKYGHKEGDKALRILANFLEDVYEDYLVIRWGGDEFIIFLEDTSVEELKGMIEDLNNRKDNWFQKRNVKYNLELTAGWATASRYEEFDNLIDLADKRMYKNK